MKFNFHFFYIVGFFCSAILMSSCNNELVEDVVETKTSKQQITFTVQRDNNSVGSRTTLTPDLDVLWEESDKIFIFDSEGNRNTFILVDGAGTTCATFTGEAVPSDKYYALYPIGGMLGKASENVFKMVLVSSSNRPEPNKIHYNLMTGVSTDSKNIQFHHALSYAKITIAAECKKIRLIGGPNDRLACPACDFTVDEDGAFVSVAQSFPQGAYDNEIYTYDKNVLLQPGTYYLRLLPGTLSELTLECINADGTYLTRSISHEVHNFETPGTVIDFGTVSEENGWKKISNHQEEVCVQHYALRQGKNNAQQVDLGLLSGLKWSSVNLGATSPEKYGDYYAWGATVPWLESYDQKGNVSSITIKNEGNGVCQWNSDHNSYDTANTPFALKTTNMQTDPNSWSKYFPGRDDKTVLEEEDDAAVQQWGDGWRMPTGEEFDELASNCYWEWCEDYNGTGIHGLIVYKAKQDADKGMFHNGSVWKKTTNGIDYVSSSQPNGFKEYSMSTDNYIFLPQPGLVDQRKIVTPGEYGRYWSSTLSPEDIAYPNNARFLYFSSNGLYDQSPVGVGGNAGREYGQPIRPVHE